MRRGFETVLRAIFRREDQDVGGASDIDGLARMTWKRASLRNPSSNIVSGARFTYSWWATIDCCYFPRR